MSGKQQGAAEPRQIVFEAGYERMKEIGLRLDAGEVTVAEMCDLYAEGKGLGRALMEYLDEREGELREIDEGRNLPRFRVVAPSEPAVEEVKVSSGSGATAQQATLDGQEPATLADFEAPGSNGASADDEIPF